MTRPSGTDTTETQILRVAVRLFAARGFHGTGIRQLADEVGIKSSTLYHYMDTKEDLLFSIVQDNLGRLLAAAERLAVGPRSPVAAVCALAALHVCSAALNRDETAVVEHELRALSDAGRAAATALRERYEQIWADAIADGVRGGEFEVHDERMARRAILRMCSGAADGYPSEGPLPLRAIAAPHAQMALGLLGRVRPFDEIQAVVAAAPVRAAIKAAWPDSTADPRAWAGMAE